MATEQAIFAGASILLGGFASAGASSAEIAAAQRAHRQAQRDADFLEELGREEAGFVIRAGDRLAGRQRVAFAGSGVDVTSGSVLDVLSETAANAEIEAVRTFEGRRQEARSLRERGQASLQIARSNATSSILSGAAQGLSTLSMFARGN